MEPTIIEAVKQCAHFLIPLLAMIVLRRCRMPIILALILSFSCVSAKELLDLQTIRFLEYDDLALNALGAMVGALV